MSYRVLDIVHREATLLERNRLMCSDREEVLEIRQSVNAGVRTIGTECALVTVRLFPELNAQTNFNQHLYPVYSEHGVLVTRTEERYSAGVADAATAERLAIAPGHPVLKIERLAYSLANMPIEWRISTYLPTEISCVASL